MEVNDYGRRRKPVLPFLILAVLIAGLAFVYFRGGDESPFGPAEAERAEQVEGSSAVSDPAQSSGEAAEDGTVSEPDGTSASQVPGEDREGGVADESEAEESAPDDRGGDSETLAVTGDDGAVRWDFVEDLARQAVLAYFPQGTHPLAAEGGVTTLTLKALNMRYGIDMPGLGSQEQEDPRAARSELLAYAFRGPVVRMVYGLYADRFVDHILINAAEITRDFGSGERRLTENETDELLAVNAAWLRAVAGTLTAMSKTEKFEQLITAYEAKVAEANRYNRDFIEVLAAYQDLQMQAEDAGTLSPDERAMLDKARDALDRSGETYQKALAAREDARRAMLSAIRRVPGGGSLDDTETLYAARWLHRRAASHPQRMETASVLAEVLEDMAARLDAAL